MKKFWVLLTFFLFPCFVFAQEVDCTNSQHQCVVCSSHYQEYFNYDITYVVYATGSGTASIQGTTNTSIVGHNTVTSNLKGGDFINSSRDGLYCPTLKAGIEVDDDISVTLSKSVLASQVVELSPTSESDNGKPFLSEEDGGTSYHCDIVPVGDRNLPEIHVQYENGQVSYSIDSSRYRVDNSFIRSEESELFANGCDVELFAYCDNDTDKCYISTEQHLGYSGVSGTDENSDEEEKEEIRNQVFSGGSETSESSGICHGENCDLDLSGICGNTRIARTLQFFGIILFIIKILVPAILIILGSVDFAQAMLSGKGDDIPKKLPSFLKRVVFGIVIFLLPSLIDFLFGVIDTFTPTIRQYENCWNCVLDPDSCVIGGDR